MHRWADLCRTLSDMLSSNVKVELRQEYSWLRCLCVYIINFCVWMCVYRDEVKCHNVMYKEGSNHYFIIAYTLIYKK